MRSSGKEFSDTSCVETGFCESKCSSESSASSPDDDGIVFMIDDGVFASDD